MSTPHSLPQTALTGNPSATDIARHYRAILGNVIPLGSNKNPLIKWKHWTTQSQTDADLDAMPWSRAYGIAAMCGAIAGGLLVADFDKQPDRIALDAFLAACGLPLNYPWLVQTPGGGFHVWLIAPNLTAPDDSRGGRVDRPGITGGHIELRHESVLVTLPPSRHPSGGRYEFMNGTPTQPPLAIDLTVLIAAYDAMTIKPEPKPAPPAHDLPLSDLPSDASELLNIETRVRREIARRLVKRGGKPGVYCCPLDHGPDGKDFLFNVEPESPVGGCMGKHRGELTRWVDLAAHLQIDVAQIAREVAAERRPVRSDVATLYRTATAASRFGLGLPITLFKRMVNIHLKVKGCFQRQHPSALVWAIWHELPDDRPMTVGDFQTATQRIGRNLTRHTVETGFDQLVAWGVGEFCERCDLPTIQTHIVRLQDSQNPGGRPGRVFRFFPIDQQLQNFERHYAYLMREYTFAGVPSDVQPEYGDLTDDQIAALDALRAPVYEEYASQREQSQVRLDQQTGYLSSAAERILAGRYVPVKLPPGPLPSAAALVKAMHKADLEAAGGEREQAYMAQFDLGVSRSTLARNRAAIGAISVPREGRIPLEQVTPYQHDNGLVLAEHDDGTATVRLPSAEKFADLADDHERKAYEKLCQRQRENRARVTAGGPRAENTPSCPTSIPVDYSEKHLLEQFEFTPGAAQIPYYDPETGEVYTPAQRWRLMSEELTNGQKTEAPTADSMAKTQPSAGMGNQPGENARGIIQSGTHPPDNSTKYRAQDGTIYPANHVWRAIFEQVKDSKKED